MEILGTLHRARLLFGFIDSTLLNKVIMSGNMWVREMLVSSGRVVSVLYFSIEKWAEYNWELSPCFFIYFVDFHLCKLFSFSLASFCFLQGFILQPRLVSNS